MTCPRSHSGQSLAELGPLQACVLSAALCVSDLGHVSESNRNQNKSLLVYLWFSMIHTSASVHLCKPLRMDVMYIFLPPNLSSFKQLGSHPRCYQDSVQPIPLSELSFPTCAAGTLLLSDPERTPAPLGLALVRLEIGQVFLKMQPRRSGQLF